MFSIGNRLFNEITVYDNMYNFYVYNIVHCTYFINDWAQTARGQLDFQFLAQDFQIEEDGSQDFLIQNVSGSNGDSVKSDCPM